jgi:hypothetical protein
VLVCHVAHKEWTTGRPEDRACVKNAARVECLGMEVGRGEGGNMQMAKISNRETASENGTRGEVETGGNAGVRVLKEEGWGKRSNELQGRLFSSVSF